MKDDEEKKTRCIRCQLKMMISSLSLCVCVLAEELILSFPWLDLLSFIFWWLVLGKFWLL